MAAQPIYCFIDFTLSRPRRPLRAWPAVSASNSNNKGKDMILESIPEAWGPKLELGDAAIATTKTGPNTIRFTAPAHYFLVLFTPQPHRQIALNSDRATLGLAPTGSVEVIPRQHELLARWAVAKENLLMGLSDERLRRLAGMELGDDQVRWQPPKLGSVDRRALCIARHIRDEIENDDPGKTESLNAWITLLGAHMLRTYSHLTQRSLHPHAAKLSPRAHQRIEEFIRAHLDQNINLESLATIANLSPSHFSRAFRQVFGLPPHQYIIKLRLERARQLSLWSTLPFGEIARLTGFSNNSHMTMTMRRAWGITPSEIRRKES